MVVLLTASSLCTGAPDVGVLNGVSTGDWQVYTNATCDVSVSGRHDLYLVFEAGLNLDWFAFIGDVPAELGLHGKSSGMERSAP